jgi:hypothetical protein
VTARIGPADVLVVIPARDEADTIGDCLEAVCTALRRARAVGAVDSAYVAVCAHRSLDDTAEIARTVLGRRPEIGWLVQEEQRELTVGEVRHGLVEAGLMRWRLADAVHPGWLFSTDADSVVPSSWVTRLLERAQSTSADLVLGMVELADWTGGGAALARYRQIIAAGVDGDGHRHVYAANLAIRLRTYLAAGGFPAVEHGEEHALLEAVRAIGATVTTPRSPTVRTSARMPGRAAHGVGALLAALVAEADALESPTG